MRAAAALVAVLLFFPTSLGARGRGLTRLAVAASPDLVFFATESPVKDGKTSWAVWRTDGTPDGTWLITLGASYLLRDSFLTLNGRLYFLSSTRGTVDLWLTDGSRAPAEHLNSFGPAKVWGLTANDHRLFWFTQNGTVPGCFNCVQLWAGDGTPERSRVIATLFTPEAAALAASSGRRMLFKLYPSQPFEWGGRKNYDLWSTDGTTGGTISIADSVPRRFYKAGDLLFFGENEVWRTDGTVAGTYRMAANAQLLGSDATAAFFTEPATGGEYAIWKTDGTLTGTTRVGSTPSRPFAAGSVAGRLIAVTRENVWLFDGTARHAVFSQWLEFWPEVVTFQGRALFFFKALGRLWRSDGTPEGTFSVATVDAIRPFFDIGGRVVFWATDGVHGMEPWVTDGTTAGTRMIANLAEDLEGSIRGRVYDRDTGAPVAGASVEYRDDNCYSSCGTVVTDADGRYAIELVREKTWLTVTAPGYILLQTSTFVGAKASVELDIPLVLGGRIAGRVTRRDGTPITRSSVQFAESLLGKRFASAELRSDGTYESGLMDPKVPLMAFVNLTYLGYSLSIFGAPSCAAGCDASTPYTAVYPPRGGTLAGVDLIVTEQANIKGRVLDAGSGAPLAGVEIQGWTWWTPDSGPQVKTVSRADGTYEMRLPDGKYWVRANPTAASGYTQMWFPDISCARCIAPPQGSTLIVPEPEQVIEHDFRLPRR